MPLIRDTPLLRRRLRQAKARSLDGIVTFGDLLGSGRPQGRIVPVKDPATGQLTMVREVLPPPVIDPIEERRHYLTYIGLNLLGHIEDDRTADLPSSLAAGDSIRDALHRSSPENDRIFAGHMRQLIADLRAVDGLKGFKQIDRLESLIAEVLD